MTKPGSNNTGLAQTSAEFAAQDVNPAVPVDANEDGGVINPLELVRDRLEGRWFYAISASILIGATAAAIAWFMAPVNFKAEGWLKGNSQNEVIVEQITETGETKNFNYFLESQALLLKSAGVVEHALNSPELKQLNRERGYHALITQIDNNLKAGVYQDTELLFVEFSDKDADVTAIITNAIMTSYITLHGSQGDDRLKLKKQQLRQFKQENRLAAESRRQQQQTLLRKSKYGIAEVSAFASENANAMVMLEEQKKKILETQAKLETAAKKEGRELTGTEIDEPKLVALEAFNPSLVTLKTDIHTKEVEYDQLRARLSVQHRDVRILESSIVAMTANLKERIEDTKQNWYEGPGKDQSYDRLNETLQKLGTRITDKRAEIDEMNAMRDSYASLEREIEDLDTEFAVLDDRLSGIEFEEDALEERISVAQLAIAPLSPFSDKRVQIAGAAFSAGFLGVMALFFLLGSVDQRAFALRQLQTDKGQFQCLGVVPDTGPTSDDPEALDVAMSCVHRLRNRIESIRGGKRQKGFVLLISSPFQGDGKTTIATLLGWSYAEAGYLTCLVDSDFIGRSLSHQFGKLHDTGLKEVLKDGKITDHVIPLGNPNLNILPIGLDDSINAEHMPLSLIKTVLDDLRDQFDLIIVDTGPLSGSVESTPIAGAVDGVLLTLRKGRSRLPLRRCVQELRELGAPYFGVILNYADKSDYRHFSSTSKSIDELLREEASGERIRNPLTDRIAGTTRTSLGSHGDD